MIKFALGLICGCFLVLILRTPICTYFNFWITLFKNELEKEKKQNFVKNWCLNADYFLTMNYFYKLPTKFEDTNPIYYINLTSIQTISIELEYPTTNIGYIKVAYLVINGIKYLYDRVSILVKDKMTDKEIEENNKKDLEFKRIQARLEMIVQDIIEKARLCRQESNEIEIERLKSAFALDTEMLEKAEKREDSAKRVIEEIEQYCERKLAKFGNEDNEITISTYYTMIDVLNIINPQKYTRDKIKQICGISKSDIEHDLLGGLR